jgi:hypothetical protein
MGSLQTFSVRKSFCHLQFLGEIIPQPTSMALLLESPSTRKTEIFCRKKGSSLFWDEKSEGDFCRKKTSSFFWDVRSVDF